MKEIANSARRQLRPMFFINHQPQFLYSGRRVTKKPEHLCVKPRTALLLIYITHYYYTQDRNYDFEGGQVESTFSRGPCDLTSGTISKKVRNERCGYHLSKDPMSLCGCRKNWKSISWKGRLEGAPLRVTIKEGHLTSGSSYGRSSDRG